MKSREAMVLIFNSMVSHEILRTNFTPTCAITFTYINIYIYYIGA